MFNNPTSPTGAVIAPITGQSIFGGDDEEEETTAIPVTNRPNGICVPNFSPGLAFWADSGARQICSQVNAKCVVVYESGLLDDDPELVSGGECLEAAWAESANRVCTAMGDCGGAVNYNGVYSDDGYKWVEDGVEKFLS